VSNSYFFPSPGCVCVFGVMCLTRHSTPPSNHNLISPKQKRRIKCEESRHFPNPYQLRRHMYTMQFFSFIDKVFLVWRLDLLQEIKKIKRKHNVMQSYHCISCAVCFKILSTYYTCFQTQDLPTAVHAKL